MKQHFFAVVVLHCGIESVGKHRVGKLTVDRAKKLLPPAAGINNADFKALLKDPRPDVVRSKSCRSCSSHFVLRKTRMPTRSFGSGGRTSIRVSDVTQAMWISRDEGYASFLQPNDITECTVNRPPSGLRG